MKRLRAWLKEGWIRLKACKELMLADSYIVITRAGETIFTCTDTDCRDQIIDEALDFSCRAMTARVMREEFEAGGESVASEAKDILRRASGES